MSNLSLVLVLVAAALHATWNYQIKKSRNKLAFVWWFQLMGLMFFLPLLIYYLPQVTIPARGWLFIAATGGIHAFYFGFLSTAYEGGDLSLVYPIARGTGPLLVPILAVCFIHEQICFMAGMGILLITSGIYCLHLPSFEKSDFFAPFSSMGKGTTLWALGTGLTIASYSIVDKIGVTCVDPVVYLYFLFLGSWMLLTPCVLAKKGAVKILEKEWGQNRKSILIVGFLCFFTYLIVLYAMRISKVSYVVSVRESSILMSVFFGSFFLKETLNRQKLFGSLVIFFGVILIGISK